MDLCYIDPPFNSKRNYNQIYSTENVKDIAQSQAFVDTWSWGERAVAEYNEIIIKDPNYYGEQVIDTIQGFMKILGKTDLMAYLVAMCVRIREIYRVLKPTGSFYLHCDPTASHYLKILLDAIFGGENFRNEIVWCYKSRPQPKKYFGQKHDVIFFYSKNEEYFFDWTIVARDLSEATISKYRLQDDDGRLYRLQGRGIKGSPIKSAKDVNVKWEIEHPELVVRDYLDEKIGVALEDWWTDIDILNQSAKERLGYPTQKPLALMERILKASSREGDVVLDAFCGCGTTIDASVRLGRKFIGIDITYQSISLILKRLKETHGQECINSINQHGIPRDIESARALALKKDDRLRKEFEKWAVLTYTDNYGIINDKKGADGGVDGTLHFGLNADNLQTALLQVKSGKVQDKDIKDFATTIRDNGAKCGYFLTLENPTEPMIKRAYEQGSFNLAETTGYSIAGKAEYPVISIITIDDMMNGAMVNLPLPISVLKTATRTTKEITKDMDLS